MKLFYGQPSLNDTGLASLPTKSPNNTSKMAEDPVTRSIEAKKTKLKLLETTYKRALELIKSEEWTDKREKALERVGRLVRSYQGGEPTLAVYLMGQIREIIGEADGPLQVIREYESERKSLQELNKR